MQYDQIDLRVRDRDGERIIEIDGFYHPNPESKYTEYERHVIADLTDAQAQRLHEQLGTVLAEES